jgi:hypothetical protein
MPRKLLTGIFASTGSFRSKILLFGRTRIRLIALGRNESAELRERYPEALQLTWDAVIGFVWDRFRAYRDQKRHVEQWDDAGRFLRQLSDAGDRAAFIGEVARFMGLTLGTS